MKEASSAETLVKMIHQYDIISQKTMIYINNAMITSNHTVIHSF